MAIVYKDFINGEFVEQSDQEYKDAQPFGHELFESVLKSLKIDIVNIRTVTNNEIYQYALKFNNGKTVQLVYSVMKHSGTDGNYRMRAFVNQKINYSGNGPLIYCFGYNAGRKRILAFTDCQEMRRRTSVSVNNSSLWIAPITYIKDIYFSDDKGWTRKSFDVSLVFRGATVDKLRTLSNEQLYNRYFGLVDTNINNSHETDPYYQEPVVATQQLVATLETIKLKRNKEYRDLALKHAHYKCELCGKEKTFKTRSGVQYFDGHHLIMYNSSTQRRFSKCLDTPRNIVCLCPECHKKVHFAEDSVILDSLISLFTKHKDLFEIYNIEDFDEIVNDYRLCREEEI